MRILGLSLSHDASAVLLENDQVVAAVEEERLNRMKHWHYVPINAIRYCLSKAETTIDAVDLVAVAGREDVLDLRLRRRLLEDKGVTSFAAPSSRLPKSATAPQHKAFRSYFSDLLSTELSGADLQKKLTFYPHHRSHAFSAYATSGFDKALIVTLDGAGDNLSGSAFTADGYDVEEIINVHPTNSLGLLYEDVTKFLGYKLFDEYKVMGLAPYGDASIYVDIFRRGIRLDSDGGFTVDRASIVEELCGRLDPRGAGDEFSSEYCNVAAALQEAVEWVGLHFFGHLQKRTGLRNLCYAGGVAHNCALNGKLMYSGLFDRIYVQPASDDSGLALGAACLAALEAGEWSLGRKHDEVFLGPVPSGGESSADFRGWDACLDIREVGDIEERAAQLLAEGKVIAWVQGRCEFGPRALGNRSILADPRPASNKDRINQMIKKREAYRPFAPSVLLEAVGDYFEVPPQQTEFPTMSIVLRVREDKRALLGAVTHVDGTARLQTVCRRDNSRYWALISAFAEKTGVPILLNTSFNNHREPIVTSTFEAITCFLTTGLDALVIGNRLITKKSTDTSWLARMHVSLQPVVALQRDPLGFRSTAFDPSLKPCSISGETFRLLLDADGTRTLGELSSRSRIALTARVLEEMTTLWSERHVMMSPVALSSDLYWPTSFERQWF